MPKLLPSKLNLEQLRKQAKDLLKTYRSGGQSARDRFLRFHPRFSRPDAIDISNGRLDILLRTRIPCLNLSVAEFPLSHQKAVREIRQHIYSSLWREILAFLYTIIC